MLRSVNYASNKRKTNTLNNLTNFNVRHARRNNILYVIPLMNNTNLLLKMLIQTMAFFTL